jgi:hypothetical protein
LLVVYVTKFPVALPVVVFRAHRCINAGVRCYFLMFRG